MIIKIEKGVPIPPKGGILRSELTETLRQMKVGDSFLYPRETNRANVYVAAHRLGIKVTTRDENGSGVRVWRVK